MRENSLSNFLEVGESIKKFKPKDPFRTYSWKSIDIISEISKTEAFYVLKTNVRFSRFLECKKLDHFLNGLDLSEFSAILAIPGVLNDRIWTDLLRAKDSLLSAGIAENRAIQILLERARPLRSALGWTDWSFHLLNTYLGNLKYELVQTEERIRKVKKYSGYIKTPSAAGSKRFSFGVEDLDLETSDKGYWYERDFYSYFISPTEDFSLLEFNAGSPYTQTLIEILKKRKELPDHSKHLIFREWRDFESYPVV